LAETDSSAAIYLPASILISAVILSGALFYASSNISSGLSDLSGALQNSAVALPSGDNGSGNQGSGSGNTVPDTTQGTTSIDLSGLPDNDPIEGDSGAPVTIVEFSDFQCPFCGSFYRGTLPAIRSQYVDTGKAKFIYRDFPLSSIHPEAQKAAEAAECAFGQGKFWEMHDKIFENQQSISLASYKQWAKDLGLDSAEFDQCLDSGAKASEVQADFSAGNTVGVSGTPSFVIFTDASASKLDALKTLAAQNPNAISAVFEDTGSGKIGVLVVGAQPISIFQGVINAELA